MELDYAKGILNEIDSDNDATIISDASSLNDVIPNLVSDINLSPAGSDEIHGNGGNDLIFGDVLNTDDVFDDIAADHDLSGITEPPDGSGWEVFETLENELSTWTREDTIQYIQENHEELAKETALGTGTDDGDVRDGGHDYIYGGAGDDIIYGQEGNDTIDAGSGDDVVDGGSGFDTLVVTGETELNFSNVSNIEHIDMSEDGVDQTTTLSLDQVLSMTDENNTLQITGEEGDSVTLTGVDGGEWTHDGNGLFTNVADNSIQVSIENVNDGVDIDVDVDNGDSFQV
jgi:Ca2+-binding RTX toxin-like protein